jgi:5'-3' exonuclease
VIVHLFDGTYELFRAFYGAPSALDADGVEIGAARALLRSLVMFLEKERATHVGVAFDTVIESFRNQLFAGYKTGEGIDPALWGQFPIAEEVSRALGLVTWSMVEFEADDALATFAARAAADDRVEAVRIATPDKDLCQCVQGERVTLWDRKTGKLTGEAGVLARLGVVPARVPALLGLVGDTADGIPGVPRWGEKSAQAVLAHYASIAEIPTDAARWPVKLRGAAALAESLAGQREAALLYERLATLRTDVPLAEVVDGLRWRGPDAARLAALCTRLRADEVPARVARLASVS